MNQRFIVHDGKRDHGPFDSSAILQMIRTGELKGDTRIRRVDRADWQFVRDILPQSAVFRTETNTEGLSVGSPAMVHLLLAVVSTAVVVGACVWAIMYLRGMGLSSPTAQPLSGRASSAIELPPESRIVSEMPQADSSTAGSEGLQSSGPPLSSATAATDVENTGSAQESASLAIASDLVLPGVPEARDPRPTPTEVRSLQPEVVELHGPYMVIPIQGTIGVDVLASGVSSALQAARESDVRTVIFAIDSPGGFVSEGEALAHAVESAGRDIETIAMVRSALSAAVWVAVACDRIVMLEDSRIGACVAYSGNPGTGDARVDAKFNSAMATRVAGLAERHGHSSDLVMAMAEPSREVWVYLDTSTSAFRASGIRPPGLECSQLDTATSVLTLTASDAVRLGFALPSLSDKTRWRIIDWEELPGNIGARHMEHAARLARAERLNEEKARQREIAKQVAAERRYQQQLQQLNDWMARIPNYIEDAERREPSRYSDYYYYVDTGLWDAESCRRWRRRTDDAIAAWRTVRAGIEDIAARMETLDLVADNPGHKSAMEREYEQAALRIRQLQQHRNRNR